MSSLASFRDPGGFCFVQEGRFFRAVHPDTVSEITSFLNSNTANDLIKSRRLIGSRRLNPAEQAQTLQHQGLQQLVKQKTIEGVFEHERIGFPGYPYEWAPEMLHAAAVLTLDLAQAALKEGYGLKDASPYNILFRGSDPIFVDLLSFERRDPCDPIWKPHAQFCRTFLLPLLAHKFWGIRLADIFSTRRDGLEPADVYRLCSALQKVRRPFLSLVTLPAWLSRKKTGNATYRDRLLNNPEKARFILNASFGQLRRMLRSVRPGRNGDSHWTQYSDSNSYTDSAFKEKEEYLSAFLRAAKVGRVLDVGANTGHFSVLAARSGADVVAIDSDAGCIGILWQRAQEETLPILPLVIDLSRPSAAKGWRNRECSGFLDRAEKKFDAVILFGILHHLMVTERVPMEEILDLAAGLTKRWLLIEFIAPQDSMFRIIARGRDALYADLTKEKFEAACQRVFVIEGSRQLSGMNRWLYLLRKPD